MKKSPWPRYTTRESGEKKKRSIFDDFGVKEHRNSETISDENCYLHRSTRLFILWDSGA